MKKIKISKKYSLISKKISKHPILPLSIKAKTFLLPHTKLNDAKQLSNLHKKKEWNLWTTFISEILSEKISNSKKITMAWQWLNSENPEWKRESKKPSKPLSTKWLNNLNNYQLKPVLFHNSSKITLFIQEISIKLPKCVMQEESFIKTYLEV